MDHQGASLSLCHSSTLRQVPTQDIKMATTNLGLSLKVKIWKDRERISLPEVPAKSIIIYQ